MHGIFPRIAEMMSPSDDSREVGAWNPEIYSTLPSKYLPMSSMFHPDNVVTTPETAHELSDFTGLPIQQLICFRPQRLVVHELLIRVSADIFVSDGSKYADLGVNFRRVVDTILKGYVEPHMDEIVERFDQLRQEIETRIGVIFDEDLFASTPGSQSGREGFSVARLFGRKAKKPAGKNVETLEQRHQRILADWQQHAKSAEEPLSKAVYSAISTLGNALLMKHGRIIGERDLLISIASGLAVNAHGSIVIGDMIAPWVAEATASEGLRVLPAQTEPVVINVKGASASGKSTMRPRQRLHVEKLGLNWEDFALISPDIWRKYLLDYDSLGEAYKYAGTLAGDEIPIVDQKLDRYIEGKAQAGRISHLLIDRFRFDSFAPGRDTEQGSNLLTRFGHTVYLIFMVTPPPSTVERAWLRGLQVGRYKSVDDLLFHNIEAFTGIPVLFFTWALRHDKTVFYEFLDNSVAYKQLPKTIACGQNDEMYLLDFKCMLDIVRYTKINIEATRPEEVYPPDSEMCAGANTEFLVQCARKIPRIHFVERASGLIYASMEKGQITWLDREVLQRAIEDEQSRVGFSAMLPGLLEHLDQIEQAPARPLPEDTLWHILGDASDGPNARTG